MLKLRPKTLNRQADGIAERILGLTGVPIAYAEFMNEPNMAKMGGAPETKLVGPCACGDVMALDGGIKPTQIEFYKSRDLLEACKEKADIFSYHCYAHSGRDKKAGYVYMIMNNSGKEITTVTIPREAERYTVSAEALRATEVRINGQLMQVQGECKIPSITPIMEQQGTIELQPHTITFLVFS